MTVGLTASNVVVNGRPEDVRRLSAGFEAYAEDLRATRLHVGRALRRIDGWRGEAAVTCRDRLANTAHGLAACEEAGARAAAALRTYGSRLGYAQETATFASSVRADADKMTTAWAARRAYMTGVDPTAFAAEQDPGEALRLQAQALATDALAAQTAAARAAAMEVAAAGDVLNSHATWQLATELVPHVGRDVRDGLVDGVGELLAAASWLARLPLNPRDSAGDVQESMTWTVTHPLAAAKELVGWEDLAGGHPARAVAQLVPGLVVTRGLSRGLALLRDRSRLDPDWPALPEIPEQPALTLSTFLGGDAGMAKLAGDIPTGHAWTKHGEQWQGRGVGSPEELSAKIDLALRTPTFWFRMTKGRAAIWSDDESAIVVYNPDPAAESTAYPADAGLKGWKQVLRLMRRYFDEDPSIGDDYEPVLPERP